MAPKKRKSSPSYDDNASDDEKLEVNAHVSKRGRLVNPSLLNKAELKFDLKWCQYDEDDNVQLPQLYYLWSEKLVGCKKIASFDIDNTIIVTKSGKNFAQNANDWQWFSKMVPKKLKELNESGYRIVFITNQGGIEKKKTSFKELQTKFEAILVELDIPVFIFVATGESHFRKPSTEMWNFFIENCNKSEEVNMNESFFVGDAAGRPKNWAPGKPKDFSCGDRMFASNLNIKFYTPEEYFLDHKPVKFEWGTIDPLEVLSKHKNVVKSVGKKYNSDKQEVVLMFGPPASGKSTFTKRHLIPNNYESINRDTLQTQEKCLKVAEEALKKGKSVSIDNTNPSKKVRSEYINLAKKYKVPVRCFVMKTPLELCHHLNYVRQNYSKGKSRRVPDVGYNMFKKQLEDPKKDEGFEEIVEIDFVPDFDDNKHETIFKQRTN